MTDTWDPSVPRHKEIAHGIEVGDGIPEMRTIEQARKAIKTVGFEIEYEEDLADRPDEVPWYYPLEGDLSKAQTAWDLLTVWRIHWSGRFVTRNSMRVMELFGLIPKGTCSVAEQLETAMRYLVEGGQKKVCRSFHCSSCCFLFHSLSSSLPCTWLLHASQPTSVLQNAPLRVLLIPSLCHAFAEFIHSLVSCYY